VTDSDKYEIISLTFFKDWHELAKKYKLTKEQYGAVVFAMCEYSFYDIEAELENAEGMMFEMSKPYIKSSNRKKIEASKGGKNARGKSGAPSGNNNASKKGNIERIVGEVEALFLKIWERYPDTFTNPYVIKDKNNWNSFWDNCIYSKQEIKTALSNLYHAVKDGNLEKRYISPHPDIFLNGGMIQRGLSM